MESKRKRPNMIDKWYLGVRIQKEAGSPRMKKAYLGMLQTFADQRLKDLLLAIRADSKSLADAWTDHKRQLTRG